MKLVSAMLLATVGSIAGQSADAAAPSAIDTLTCTRSDGTTLKHNVYAFTLNSGKSTTRYFTIYFLDTLLGTYTSEEIFGAGFSYCQLGRYPEDYFDNVTVLDVNTSGIGANVGIGSELGGGSSGIDTLKQAYTEVTFQYTFLVFGTQAITGLSTTPEEQAKALAAFKAKGLALPK